jgi:hypothetical protein
LPEIRHQIPGSARSLPSLQAITAVNSLLPATLRAHFGSNDGPLSKCLHMPDERRVLDG